MFNGFKIALFCLYFKSNSLNTRIFLFFYAAGKKKRFACHLFLTGTFHFSGAEFFPVFPRSHPLAVAEKS